MNGLGGFMAGSIVAKLLLDKTGWNESIKSVNKDTAGLVAKAAKVGTEFQAVGKFVGAAGVAVTSALGLMVKKTADAGDAIFDMSQRTGVAAETLSAYKLAADKSGSSLEGLATGLRGLASRMLDAKNGLAESKRAFDMLGVSVVGADGNLRPLNDVMLEVADKFAVMEDGATKTALAQDIFGRSGMQLIPMLNLGADGLRTEAEEARRLGIVFDGPAAAAADKFNDAIVSLKASFEGMRNTVGTALMPAIQSLVSFFTGLFSGITNIARANEGLTKTVSQLALSFGGAATAIGATLVVVGTLLVRLPLLAAAVGTTTGALLASVAAWTAVATAVGYYIIKLGEVREAEILADKANAEYWATYERFRAKLLEVAKAAGLNVYQFNELTAKYGDNINALALAIKRGQEGKALQEAMAKVGAEHAAVIEQQRTKLLGLAPALDLAKGSMVGLKDATVDAVAAFNSLAASNLDFLTFEPSLETDGLADDVDTAMGLIRSLQEQGAAQAAQASDEARKTLEAHQALTREIFADIINGFTSIMDGSKTMGEVLSSIVTTMIADLGKLVIAEMLAAKKSILASQMEAAAKYIASIFKKVPFPLNIVLAAGGFALISKLFSKLLKFKEGGVFKEPTIAEVGHGTEYVLPEKKLINIVRDAMTLPAFTAAPAMATVGRGTTVSVNFSGPLIQTTGLARRDLIAAGEQLRYIVDGQLRRVSGRH